MAKEKLVRITIGIPEADMKAVRAKSKDFVASLAYVIRLALREYFKKEVQ